MGEFQPQLQGPNLGIPRSNFRLEGHQNVAVILDRGLDTRGRRFAGAADPAENIQFPACAQAEFPVVGGIVPQARDSPQSRVLPYFRASPGAVKPELGIIIPAGDLMVSPRFTDSADGLGGIRTGILGHEDEVIQHGVPEGGPPFLEN